MRKCLCTIITDQRGWAGWADVRLGGLGDVLSTWCLGTTEEPSMLHHEH